MGTIRLVAVQGAIGFFAIGLVNLTAAPILTVKSSTTQMRKGEPCKIYLRITAQDSTAKVSGLKTGRCSGIRAATETYPAGKSRLDRCTRFSSTASATLSAI